MIYMKVIDMTGTQWGSLTVLERAENSKDGRAMWKCQCECGEERIVLGKQLRNGQVTKCKKCARKGINSINLTGQRFGRLTVLEMTDKRRGSSIIWKCRCDCGEICYKPSKDLRDGRTKSCGCLQKENRSRIQKDLRGMRFGKLIVLDKEPYSLNNRKIWYCKCDCGNYKEVSTYQLLAGRVQSCGCLQSKGNALIQSLLNEMNICFETEKTFPNCQDNYFLRFDFYLPGYNCCIEYDGLQHFKATGGWNNEEYFENITKKDEIKNQYCKENNINLIRIPYTDYEKLTKDYLFTLINNA